METTRASELDSWAGRLALRSYEIDVYAYLNNDWEGYAVRNALYLRRRLLQEGTLGRTGLMPRRRVRKRGMFASLGLGVLAIIVGLALLFVPGIALIGIVLMVVGVMLIVGGFAASRRGRSAPAVRS